MKKALTALVLVVAGLTTACDSGVSHPSAFGQVSEAEFRQPLPEPPVHEVGHAPSAATVLANVARSSMESAKFQIVGTEPAPRPQGQIGAQVYHQNGTLAIGPPALEL